MSQDLKLFSFCVVLLLWPLVLHGLEGNMMWGYAGSWFLKHFGIF
jgi:hypothetical protein